MAAPLPGNSEKTDEHPGDESNVPGTDVKEVLSSVVEAA